MALSLKLTFIVFISTENKYRSGIAGKLYESFYE